MRDRLSSTHTPGAPSSARAGRAAALVLPRLVFVASVALCALAGCTSPKASSSPAAPSRLREVPLGLCEDYPEETRTLASARRDLELLRAAGLRVLRISFGWDGIEPEKDRYDFAFWDAFVDMAVREYGVTLIPYVAYTPRWNSDGGERDFWKTPPRDVGEFEEIVRLLASRYRGRIRSWELWNEPDNRDYWLGSAAEYAELLAAGSRAVRATDPEAAVVFGGIAGGVEFLSEAFDRHDASASVDVVNLHSYFETWNPEPLESIPAYVGRVAELIERHGGRQTIWMAEVGYSNFRRGRVVSEWVSATFDYEHTLEFQAVALVRTVVLSLTRPEVSLVAWYELKDPPGADAVIGDVNNRHLGVAFADHRPKPAFDALRFMNRTFEAGFRVLSGELRVLGEPAPDRQIHGFRTARGDVVLVAWLGTRGASSPSERDTRHQKLRVALPFEPRGAATLYDARGSPRGKTQPRRAGAGSLEVELDLRGGEVSVLELPVTER